MMLPPLTKPELEDPVPPDEALTKLLEATDEQLTQAYVESNVRSAEDLFEAMQDELCSLVPIGLMQELIPAKYERVRVIEAARRESAKIREE
jgi:hypothetical protein